MYSVKQHVYIRNCPDSLMGSFSQNRDVFSHLMVYHSQGRNGNYYYPDKYHKISPNRGLKLQCLTLILLVYDHKELWGRSLRSLMRKGLFSGVNKFSLVKYRRCISWENCVANWKLLLGVSRDIC